MVIPSRATSSILKSVNSVVIPKSARSYDWNEWSSLADISERIWSSPKGYEPCAKANVLAIRRQTHITLFITQTSMKDSSTKVHSGNIYVKALQDIAT